MYISNFRDRVQRLLTGIPHSVVLESICAAAIYLRNHSFIVLDIDGDMALMVPATLPVSLKHPDKEGIPKVLFLHRDQNNTQASTSNKFHSDHYLYPVHLSHMFLFTTTLESALYLLLLRILHKQYEDAFQLADSCISDVKLSREAGQVKL